MLKNINQHFTRHRFSGEIKRNKESYYTNGN